MRSIRRKRCRRRPGASTGGRRGSDGGARIPSPLLLALFLALPVACAEGPPAGDRDARETAGAAGGGAGEREELRLEERYEREARELSERPRIRAAFEHLRRNHDRTIEEQIRLTEIPAPPFGEERRARAYAGMLREAGADSVFLDEEGNAIGIRRGTAGAGIVVLSGHLDTVFPEGTGVTVRRSGDTLRAPGIGDDARGLAVLLSVLRALDAAEIRTRADLWFVGTVGEEGLGDLRGVKHLFREGGPPIDAFVSVDGDEPGEIVNRALGSRRYRVTFRGPGGHSWGDFGLGNPAHALGVAIGAFVEEADAYTAEGPKTSYNVGRIGGGTAINAVPDEAWMEVDMRSLDRERLGSVDSLFRAAMERSLVRANRLRREGPRLEMEVELVGDRPSGEVDPATPLVQRAAATARLLGHEVELRRSSTDANTPIAAGVPALTTGGGGESRGAHSVEEWWRHTGDAHEGVQRILLLAVAQAGPDGSP